MHSELIKNKKNYLYFENFMQLTAGIFKKKAIIITDARQYSKNPQPGCRMVSYLAPR